MLDVLSNGRLVAGMVVGGGPEYYTYASTDHAREKFREALDLIVKAWTTPGPFLWNSKHYYFPYVNPWPPPIQNRIRPSGFPVLARWKPSSSWPSGATGTWASPTSATCSARFSPCSAKPATRPATRPTPSRWAGASPSTSPRRTGKPARRSSRIWYFIRNLLKNIALAPPGYTSARSAPAIIRTAGSSFRAENLGRHREGRLRHRRQPRDVRQKLAHCQKELGCGVVLTGCQTGAINHELTRKSMELLAREVLPKTRGTARLQPPRRLNSAHSASKGGRPLVFPVRPTPVQPAVLCSVVSSPADLRQVSHGDGAESLTKILGGRPANVLQDVVRPLGVGGVVMREPPLVLPLRRRGHAADWPVDGFNDLQHGNVCGTPIQAIAAVRPASEGRFS